MGMEIVHIAHKSKKDIFSKRQEVKSVQKCTIAVTRPSMMFEDLTLYAYFNVTNNNIKTPIKWIQYLMGKK
jgi:hypothetical protein